MNRDARTRCSRPASHEANARLARRFCVTFRHEGRTAFLSVGNEFDFREVAEAIEHGDVAFPGYAEDVAHTFIAKTVGDGMASKHTLISSGSFRPRDWNPSRGFHRPDSARDITFLHGSCQCCVRRRRPGGTTHQLRNPRNRMLQWMKFHSKGFSMKIFFSALIIFVLTGSLASAQGTRPRTLNELVAYT